jgi:hypothetical protein
MAATSGLWKTLNRACKPSRSRRQLFNYGRDNLVGRGSWITPKRVMIAVAVLILLSVIGRWNKGANSPKPHGESSTTGDATAAESQETDSSESKPNRERQTSAPLTLTAEQRDAIKALKALRCKVFVKQQDGQPFQLAVSLETVSTHGRQLAHLAHVAKMLTELHLEESSIDDFSLLEPLVNIHTLYLNSLDPGAKIQSIAKLPRLESLSLTLAPNISISELAVVLRQCQSLRHLRIEGNIRNAEIPNRFEWLSQINSKLVFLQIPAGRLSAIEVQTIAACNKLETLVLKNSFGDKTPSRYVSGIENLSQCKSIRRISMQSVDDQLIESVLKLPFLNTFNAPYATLSDAMWKTVESPSDSKTSFSVWRPNGKPYVSADGWWYDHVPKLSTFELIDTMRVDRYTNE